MPVYVHALEPVIISVQVNDPVISKEANIVELGFDNAYTVGGQVERSNSFSIRTFIPYSGGPVTVGFIGGGVTPDSETAGKPNVQFIFYAVKKAPSGVNPSTDSEYAGYSCETYVGGYFCGSGSCEVCIKRLGIVAKEYWVLPSKPTAIPPSGHDWVDTSKNNSFSLSYTYNSENTVCFVDDKGESRLGPDSSTLGISPTYYGVASDMKSLKEWQLTYHKVDIASGRTTVKDATGPGGLFPGKGIEVIVLDTTSTEFTTIDWDFFRIDYQLIAQAEPSESGTMQLTMKRVGCAPKGGGKAAINKAIADAKQFAASYKLLYEGGGGSGFKPKHWYDVLKRETGNSITGRITDGHNNPMPYMTVSIEYVGRSYDTRTDDGGNYEINIPSLQLAENKYGTLKLSLSYVRDGKNYFNVLDHQFADKLVVVEKNFSLETEMDKTQNFDYGTTSFTDTSSSSNLNNLKHIGPIYYHLSEITDYALTQFKANIDYKLPVDVYFAAAGGTLYSRDTSSINIDAADSAYGSSDRPDNREYHEFCHHILFSQWNGQGLRGPGDTNHGGYINALTGDSYTEGFAEFCAMACSKYKGEPKPEIYAGFGSMELNYKAWQHRGYSEELAVNGILWDLYDDKNDANDTISLPLDRMWEVMKVKRANFYEYYKAFRAAFPDKADGIEKIFIDHGFFADKNIGNGVRDAFEPYADTNGDGAYNAGDFFVDYGVVNGTEMTYDAGEVIGKAANYERENRSSVVKLPGSYVKASDSNVKTYKIMVHLMNPALGEDFEYNVDAVGGLVYVAPIPEDVDADITITPDSLEYTSDKPYTTTNKEFIRKYYSAPDSQGFFDSHDFEVKPTGLKDVVSVIEEKGPTVSGGTTNKEENAGEDTESDVSVPLWAIGGGILLIGGGIFFVICVVVVLLLLMKKKGK